MRCMMMNITIFALIISLLCLQYYCTVKPNSAKKQTSLFCPQASICVPAYPDLMIL